MLVSGTENTSPTATGVAVTDLIDKCHDFPVGTMFHMPIHCCDEFVEVRLVKTFASHSRLIWTLCFLQKQTTAKLQCPEYFFFFYLCVFHMLPSQAMLRPSSKYHFSSSGMQGVPDLLGSVLGRREGPGWPQPLHGIVDDSCLANFESQSCRQSLKAWQKRM